MRHFKSIAAILMGLAPFFAANAHAQIAGSNSVGISPFANYQDSFERLAKAADRASFDAEMARLVELIGTDQSTAIEQLLWYSTKHDQHEKTPALVGGVIKIIGASNEAMIRALVPHLDNVDSELRGRAARWLVGCEDHSAVRPPDFSIYRAIIEEDIRANREPQITLVRHMFQSDAAAALLTMVRACQLRDPADIKPILWAEHTVADLLWKRRNGFVGPKDTSQEAVAELETLSRHSLWWVRLFAAEVIRNIPELATPGMKERLQSDENGAVREAATRKQD
ncbi:MAG: hypothetical protein IPK83_09645 [Planctomycetes bacterium]|nr:hypothetical protein [Planctomycetota bacterium]